MNIVTTPIQSYFDLNGQIKSEFKNELDLLRFKPEHVFKDVSLYHIRNVYAALNSQCFQKDLDFFKKKKVSEFSSTLSVQQCEAFLNEHDRNRKIVMPRTTDTVDAVVPSGAPKAIIERLLGLRIAFALGYNFNFLHFIVKDQAERNQTLGVVRTKFPDIYARVICTFTRARKDNHTGLLELSRVLSPRFAIISSSNISTKIEGLAKKALGNSKECVGIVSVPFGNWKDKMARHGYLEALGDEQAATIAWTASELNFLAREVDAEFWGYQERQRQVRGIINICGMLVIASFSVLLFNKLFISVN